MFCRAAAHPGVWILMEELDQLGQAIFHPSLLVLQRSRSELELNQALQAQVAAVGLSNNSAFARSSTGRHRKLRLLTTPRAFSHVEV